MEINGLPLHPLSVHAAVVLGPLATLAAIAYAVPAWRDRARWPLVVLAVVAAVAVVIAYVSGNSFRDANEFFRTPPSDLTATIDDHQDLGTILLWVTLGFAVVTGVVAGLLHGREGAVRHLASAALVGVGIGVLVLTFMTGEAGASAVWDGVAG